MTVQEWLACDNPMAMMNFLIKREEADHRGWRRWIPSVVSAWISRKRSHRRTYLLVVGMLRHWVRLFPLENLGDGHVKFSKDLRIEEVFRDIFGSPFRSESIETAWRTGAVTALADAIYADRAFDRLPILADALEDAGCTNRAILDHCRGPGPHVRGCWVVDLVLGKQ